jgi:PhzF family phenazine biosynthesis protein
MTDGGHGAEVLRYAAFTMDGAGGNPAGVVLDAAGLDDEQRQAVAAEVGFSETAFVDAPDTDRRYRVRYFSPRAEVDFCGHATVAAAVALAEREGPGTVRFDTRAGEVPVRTQQEQGGITATLTSVATRTRPAAPDELAAALVALRWSDGDLDPRFPPHVAYAGVEHLVVAVRERATLAALDYDYPVLAELMARSGWTTVHAVHAADTTRFSARDPFPPGGVVEDPATGAAAAAFGGYLRALGLVPVPTRVTIEQGVDMGRPSRLLVDIAAEVPGIDVTGAAKQM